jgi:hypothetical protein
MINAWVCCRLQTCAASIAMSCAIHAAIIFRDHAGAGVVLKQTYLAGCNVPDLRYDPYSHVSHCAEDVVIARVAIITRGQRVATVAQSDATD